MSNLEKIQVYNFNLIIMLKNRFSFIAHLLIISILAFACGNHWVSIFNGKNLDGWIQKNGTATYRAENGMLIGKTEKGSSNSFLCSKEEYADFELKFEVKLLDKQLNSGVQIRSKTKEPGNGREFGDVNGPQIEIEASGSDGGNAGYIYGEAITGWMTPKGKLIPHKDFKDAEWNSFRIVAIGPRIQTWINGNQIEDLTDVEVFKTHPKGFIGLQVHGVGDQGPFQVAWRNIRVKPLNNIYPLLFSENRKYGKNLPILKNLRIGPCSDATVDQNVLFAIGNNSIYSFDISSPKNPVLLDSLNGLGNVRQIEVQDGFAYVTSREEGLFIIDVRNPKKLAKATHYDTLELATGISVSGSLAAVTNRQYGIELIDISDPLKPHFIEMLRTGEAQSVYLKDKLAFVGVWGTRKVVICDVSNPKKPFIISEVPLDGYGDGVFVRDNLCFAATGHHASGMLINEKSDQTFGKGHGLEIIDVSDPKKPKTLSRLKLPVFYQRFIDMWDVKVTGNFAFVGDTHAGLLVVNISNPNKPFFVGHVTLPETTFRGEKVNGPVGGFAIGKGVVYVAGKISDLCIVEAKGMAKPVIHEKFFTTPYWQDGPAAISSASVYHPDGQVHAAFVSEDGKKVFVAAGYGGVHEVLLSPHLKGKQLLTTGNAIFDINIKDGKMYLAEGLAGLSVWKLKTGAPPELLTRYQPKEGGVFQVVVDPDGKYALLSVGQTILDFVDISRSDKITRLKYDEQIGLMYRLPVSKGFLNGRYAGCSWHASGGFIYDLKGESGIEFKGNAFPPLGVINGISFLKEKAIAIFQGGYILQTLPIEKTTVYEKPILVKDVRLSGKPTVYGSRLYVADRMNGTVAAVDISDLSSPRKLWQINPYGNPGLVSEYGDMVIIPAGHGGLQLYKAKDGKPYYGEYQQDGL
jgi:hypothetical protein